MKTVVRCILIGLVSLLVLPLAFFGLHVAWIWVRLHVGPPFYHSSANDYFSYALFALLPAAFCFWIIGRVALRKRSALLLVVPFFIVLVDSTLIPHNLLNPQVGVESQIFRIGFTASRWGEEHGRLPVTLEEIASAETNSSPATNGTVSYYGFGNEPVQYEIVVLPHSSGPMQDQSQLTRPGRIFYAISENGMKAWITGTALDGQFIGSLCFLHDIGNKHGVFVDVASPGGHKEFFD